MAYVERQTDGAVHRGVGADRNVEPAFEVGDDVFERHVEEGQGGLYPAVVVRGVHLFDDHASGGLVEDQPFVGPEPHGLPGARRADADRAAVERRFGDAAGALVAGVERGAEHFDLHAVHIDDEGVRRVARHFEIGFAFERHAAFPAVECFGIGQAARCVEPYLRAVGQLEFAFAPARRQQADFGRNGRRRAYVVIFADGKQQHGGCGRGVAYAAENAAAPLLRFTHADGVTEPLQLFTAVGRRRAFHDGGPLLAQRGFFFVAVAGLEHPAAELRLEFAGDVVVQESADELSYLSSLHRMRSLSGICFYK